jgi:hypothetical protein
LSKDEAVDDEPKTQDEEASGLIEMLSESDTVPDGMDLEHLQHTYKVMRKVLETHAKRGSRAALKEMAQAFDLTEEDAMQHLRRAAQRLYQW